MRLAWLTRDSESDDWEITFEEPDSRCGPAYVMPIAYTQLEQGKPE